MPPSAIQSPRAILVFLPNWLGDAVMCTPALRALKKRYPDAMVTVAGKGACCAVLEGFPWVDRLLTLPDRPGLVTSLSLRPALRAPGADMAIIFPHAFRTAWLALLSGASRRIGLDRGQRRLLLTERLARHRVAGKVVPRYTALEYLDIVGCVGAVDDGQGLELAADPDEVAVLRARFDPNRPLVGIAPGAAFGPSKRWLPERFAALADRLHHEHGAQCLLLTGPGEEETRDAVLSAATTPLAEYHGGSPSIARMKAAIACMDLLIGNDSGPRHVAIALGRPVICIMGSTSPAYTQSPWERGEVLRIDVDCGPCQRPHCVTDHRCMTGISVERAAAAASRWLCLREEKS